MGPNFRPEGVVDTVDENKPRRNKLNPRYANRALREKHRARIKAMGLPCHICGKPIHYDEPSDSRHPYSYVVDEIIPISRYKEFGYGSPREAAEDFSNLAPAHWICNARKGNKLQNEIGYKRAFIPNASDGEW